ncbi:MAG: cysteine desulfurase, partial [Alphaproteobacteria bacterium]|nr:cysteine desulfurase [Alphaproteobacteria bacterium]
ATEAINLVASCFGRSLKAGDEIILTELEHHANIVPWSFLKEQCGVVLKIVPIKGDRSLDMDAFEKLLSPKTKMVAVTQMSNVLGTVVDVAAIVKKAHAAGAKVLIDGSQAIVHFDVDVRALDCDFYVFTGHKLYGPTGIGVLYGRYEALDALPPYQGGGEMIEQVSFDKITYKEPPVRFEAGTPAIVEAVGLGAAVDYLNGINRAAAHAHEMEIFHAAEKMLVEIEGVTVYSTAPRRASIISFSVDNIHPHDVATVFDHLGIAVRTGHHCAQPLMKALGVTGTVRASFALYNTMEDAEKLAAAVQKAKRLFA